MARIPYAARTLISEVTERKPKAKVKAVGEPDGLDVIRSFVFNKETGNWLKPLLEIVDDDRIESFGSGKDGLVVTFVASTAADRRETFLLGEAETADKSE